MLYSNGDLASCFSMPVTYVNVIIQHQTKVTCFGCVIVINSSCSCCHLLVIVVIVIVHKRCHGCLYKRHSCIEGWCSAKPWAIHFGRRKQICRNSRDQITIYQHANFIQGTLQSMTRKNVAFVVPWLTAVFIHPFQKASLCDTSSIEEQSRVRCW